jgi:predicted nucleic acid-binding protein
VAYLFDTDAISEVLRPKPLAVTGNLRHFRRIPGLRICTAFAEAPTHQQ